MSFLVMTQIMPKSRVKVPRNWVWKRVMKQKAHPFVDVASRK